jgi:hypothetical protein
LWGGRLHFRWIERVTGERSKVKDPHQLRVNNYRVLLTRGRDGFIVFVPNEIGMRLMYEALMGAGVRELSVRSNVRMVAVKETTRE